MRKTLLSFCFSILAFTCLRSQNVGIGTVTPGARLDVVGSETTAHGKNAAITLTNTASTNSWVLRAGANGTGTPKGGFSIGDNIGYRLIIDSLGKIGIGDPDPLAPLSIKAGSFGNKIILKGGSSASHFGIGVSTELLQLYTPDLTTDISFGYGSSTNYTERVRIEGTGNIWLNNNALYLRTVGDFPHGLKYDSQVDGPYLFGFNGGALGANNFPNALRWDKNGNVAVRANIILDTAGANDGDINNTLHFGGWSGEGIGSKRTAGGNRWGLDFYTNNTNRMSITNNGNVGIGTTAPASKLEVNGQTKTASLKVGNNGTSVSILQKGTFIIGISAAASKVVTVNFPNAFSSTPVLVATVKSDPAWDVGDTFVASIRSISTTSVTFNIQRVDAAGGWNQNLLLDWIAVQ